MSGAYPVSPFTTPGQSPLSLFQPPQPAKTARIAKPKTGPQMLQFPRVG